MRSLDESTRPGRVVVDPRLRQRWVAARRVEGRRRLRLLVAAVSLIGVVAIGVGALYSPLFRVRHVRLHGQGGAVPASLLLTTAGLTRRVQMIDVNPAAVVRRLDALAWVADARVQRQWPDTVSISVTERHAVAQVVQPGHGVIEVDATGRILAAMPSGIVGLPVLEGLAITAGSARPDLVGHWLPGTPGPTAAPDLAPAMRLSAATKAPAAVLALAAVLPAAMRGEVRSVTANAGGRVTMTVLAGGSAGSGSAVQVVVGSVTALAAKLAAVVTILQQVPLQGIAQVDVQVPDRPVLTARRQPGNVSTQAGG